MLIDLVAGLIFSFILFAFQDFDRSLLVAALIFSILPDIDFVLYHLFQPINRFSHKHRRIFHLPIPYILLGLVVLNLLSVEETYYILFVSLSMWHFIHDTFSIGYGVQWLFPISTKQYFWGKKVETAKNIFWKLNSDSPKNIDEHANLFGDDNWFRKSTFK